MAKYTHKDSDGHVIGTSERTLSGTEALAGGVLFATTAWSNMRANEEQAIAARVFEYKEKGLYDYALREASVLVARHQVDPGTYIIRGGVYISMGEFKKAINDLNKGVEFGDSYGAETKSVAYGMRGVCHFRLNNLSAALSDYSSAIKLNPSNEDWWLDRGIAAFEVGDLQQAHNDFSKAISLNPGCADAYSRRARTYFASGDIKTALADINRAIILDANQETYYTLRAQILDRMGDGTAAEADQRRALVLTGVRQERQEADGQEQAQQRLDVHVLEKANSAMAAAMIVVLVSILMLLGVQLLAILPGIVFYFLQFVVIISAMTAIVSGHKALAAINSSGAHVGRKRTIGSLVIGYGIVALVFIFFFLSFFLVF